MGILGERKSKQEQAEEGKALEAKDIVKDPDLIDRIPDRYVIIRDDIHFDTLNKSINMMAKKGWQCVSFTTMNTKGYMLMERMG